MHIAAIDIGTTKIRVVTAKFTSGTMKIENKGQASAKGLSKGIVVDLHKLCTSINEAAREAQITQHSDISCAFVNTAGCNIKSSTSFGMAKINGGEIGLADIENVITTAKSVRLPDHHKILEVIPIEYTIDGTPGIHSPLGMRGLRLEGKIRIIAATSAAIRNIVSCIENSDIPVQGVEVVAHPVAIGLGALTEEEKDSGTLLIDIGGGTTEFCLFSQGKLHLASVVPFAGIHATRDIEKMLCISNTEAENIKKKYGRVTLKNTDEAQNFAIHAAQHQKHEKLSPEKLAQILEARYREIFECIREEIYASKFDITNCTKIVLVGGGSKIQGVCKLAMQCLGVNACIDNPNHNKSISPFPGDSTNVTITGLLNFAAGIIKNETDLHLRTMSAPLRNRSAMPDKFRILYNKVKNFIKLY